MLPLPTFYGTNIQCRLRGPSEHEKQRQTVCSHASVSAAIARSSLGRASSVTGTGDGVCWSLWWPLCSVILGTGPGCSPWTWVTDPCNNMDPGFSPLNYKIHLNWFFLLQKLSTQWVDIPSVLTFPSPEQQEENVCALASLKWDMSRLALQTAIFVLWEGPNPSFELLYCEVITQLRSNQNTEVKMELTVPIEIGHRNKKCMEHTNVVCAQGTRRQSRERRAGQRCMLLRPLFQG